MSIGYLTWAPRIPDIKDRLDLTVDQLGACFMVVGVVGIFLAGVVSRIIARLGSRRAVLVAMPVMVASNALIAFASSVGMLLLGLAFSSFCTFIINTAVTTQANNLRDAGFGNQLNSLTAIANLGSVFAILVGTALLTTLSTEAYVMGLSVAVGIGIMIAASRLSPVDAVATTEHYPPMRWLGRGTLLFWFTAFGLFASTTAEFSVNDWSAILSRDDFHIVAPLYLVPFFTFQAGIVLSRFLATRLGQRFGEGRFVRANAVVCAIVWMVSIQTSQMLGASTPMATVLVAALGFFVAGWGVGSIYPAFVSATARSGYPPAVILPRVFAITSLAFVFGPGIIGLLSRNAGLPLAMLLPGLMLVTAGVFSVRVVAGAKI